MDFLKNIVKFCQTFNETTQHETGNNGSMEPANSAPKEPAKPTSQGPKASAGYAITENDIDKLTMLIERKSQYLLERMAYNHKKALEYVKYGYKSMSMVYIGQCNHLNHECVKFQKNANALVNVLISAMNAQAITAMAEEQADKLDAYINKDNQAIIKKLGTCQNVIKGFEESFDNVLGNGFANNTHQDGDLTLADFEEEIRRERMGTDASEINLMEDNSVMLNNQI
ncbi:MAG: hypothetical protein IKX48_16750 [Victivallales bacterium]|nr:hypothetical protein [Victivallales bacterium]